MCPMPSIMPVAGSFTVTVNAAPAPRPPAACVVPALKGKTLARAKTALTKANCRLGKVTRKRSRGKPGRVIGQKPRAGTTRPAGSKVAVVLSKR